MGADTGASFIAHDGGFQRLGLALQEEFPLSLSPSREGAIERLAAYRFASAVVPRRE
jgi:hypothetical protein